MVMQIELDKITDYAVGVNIIDDGKVSAYAVGQSEFSTVCAAWNEMLDGARIMPAFGVSLNRETLKAKNDGLWVEFEFGGEYEAEDMPFEKLLIKAESEWSGFNIIRYTHSRGYDGRCFYYDLVGKTMNGFCSAIKNIN